MRIDSRKLDRRVEILRAEAQDDGLAKVDGMFAAIGTRWAQKTDVSDGERVRAAAQGQSLTTRFLVRSDALTRSITGKDRLTCEGQSYAVTGTKEVGRRVGIEITADAQPDDAKDA